VLVIFLLYQTEVMDHLCGTTAIYIDIHHTQREIAP
jgi:hypothetical protein